MRVGVDFLGDAASAQAAATQLEKKLLSLGAVANHAADELAGVTFKEQQAAAAKTIGDQILESLEALTRQARETTAAVHSVEYAVGQAAKVRAESKVMAEGIENIGEQARRSSRQVKQLGFDNFLFGKRGSGASTQSLGAIVPGGAKATGPALTVAVTGAVAALAPMAPAVTSLLASIPALATAGAGAIATLVLAFGGLGDAIEGDREAFNALDPSAQQFVQTLRSLVPWVHTLKKITQDELLPALTKAFHEALSPQTVAMLENGLMVMAHGLGQAAEAWGKFIGSSNFATTMGPLLQAGAGWMKILSDAAISLTDAFLHLGRAAIPFTSWMVEGIARGAELFDQWIKGAEASGQLARGIDAGKDAIRLLGALVVALSKALFELGMALAPVGRLIDEALVSGLTHLAEWIHKNRDALIDITTGAAKAFLTVMGFIGPVLSTIFGVLNKLVTATIGWHDAFVILLTLQLLNWAKTLAGAFWGLAAAEAAAVGTAGAKGTGLKGLLANLGLLSKIGQVAVTVLIVEEIVKKITGGSWFQDDTAKPRHDVGDKNPWEPNTDAYHYWQLGYEGKPFPGGVPDAGHGGKNNENYKAWVAGKKARQGGATTSPKGGLQLPTSFTSTHDTKGIPGYQPSYDFATKMGQKILAPENGQLFNRHFIAYSGGVGGWTIYYQGAETGQTYFMTHLGAAAKNGFYQKGDVIGTGGKAVNGMQHVHVGVVFGAGTTTPTDYGPAQPPGSSTGSPFGTGAPFSTKKPKTSNSAGTSLGIMESLHLTEEQKRVANLIYSTAIAHGASPKAALAMVVGAYLESRLNPNALGGGLFQIQKNNHSYKRYLELLAQGYDPATAATIVMVADYISSTKSHPGAGPVEIAQGAEHPRYPYAQTQPAAVAAARKGFKLTGGGVPDSTPSGQASAHSIRAARKEITDALKAASSLEKQLDFIGADMSPYDRALRRKLSAYEAQLRADREFLRTHKHLTSEQVSAIKDRDARIQAAIREGAANTKIEIDAYKDKIQAAWEAVRDAVLEAFDKETSKHKTPTEILIEQLTSQHDEAALQNAVDEARENLKKALEGTTEDPGVTVAAIEAIVGKWNQAKTIDAVQAAILGGPIDATIGDQFMKQIQDRLKAAHGAPNAKAIQDAQKQLEEALFNQKMYYLQKQAEAERTAYIEARERERKSLQDSLDLWLIALTLKKASWEDFIKWLKEHGYDVPPGLDDNPTTGSGGNDGVSRIIGTHGPTGGGIPMAEGGILTRPTLVTAGEKGREGIIPLDDPRAKNLLGGDTVVQVQFADGMQWLEQFVDVRVVKNAEKINRRQGKRAVSRRRGGLMQ